MKKLNFILLTILSLEIIYFLYTETNNIVITEQTIKDAQLSKILKDIKIVQISDLHIKSYGKKEKKLVELIKKINPHILIITGDFISDNKGLFPTIEVLKDISTKVPTIAILGNNDHFKKHKKLNTEKLIESLKSININLLINESVKITIKKESNTNSFYIIGLNDNYLSYDNIFKATNNLNENLPKILLAHSPHIIEKINTEGINLILSGHTHGGQIIFPLIGAIYTNSAYNTKKKYIFGLYTQTNTKMYVNRGIGTSFLPIRLFCKPEITIFKFV